MTTNDLPSSVTLADGTVIATRNGLPLPAWIVGQAVKAAVSETEREGEGQIAIVPLKPLAPTLFEVGYKDGQVVINVNREQDPEHFVWSPATAREIGQLLLTAADAAEEPPSGIVLPCT